MIEWISAEVEDAYYQKIHEKVVNPEMLPKKREKPESSLYSDPWHGTIPCTRILTEMGFSEVLVPTEQAEPDHRFPTVTSPNPENLRH